MHLPCGAPDLIEFLFAPVGTEANGVPPQHGLGFARLGNDPWQEARRLAGLPKPEAVSISLWCKGRPNYQDWHRAYGRRLRSGLSNGRLHDNRRPKA